MSDTQKVSTPPNPSNLAELLENNKKWAQAVSAAFPGFFPGEGTLPPQMPKILWIGCSDSRVPENTIFAAMPGAIFSTRNIANQVPLDDDNTASVISFAVGNLGVEHIVVAGHTACGGVQACYNAAKGIETDGVAPSAVVGRWLTPLTEHAGALLEGNKDLTLQDLTRENVRRGVESVLKSECAWATKTVAVDSGPTLKGVHGVLYHLETGLVEDLGMSKTHLD